jgi:hypothetical protein
MAQVVEHSPIKQEALSSSPSIKKKKRKKERNVPGEAHSIHCLLLSFDF